MSIPARPYYYMGGNWALTRLADGAPFWVNTDDRGITPWIVMGGTWENFADNILCAVARPGSVFVDAGANQGYYTVKIGRIVGGSGHVYSFEPNPEVIPFLEENININGLARRTTLHKVAVGDAPGSANLLVKHTNIGGARLISRPAAEGALSYPVPIVRIDDVLRDVPSIDLIKFDVEGYEAAALQGARSLIDRSPQCSIVIEIGQGWDRPGALEETLRWLVADREFFGIRHSGRLTKLSVGNIRPFLDTMPGKLGYVLICSRSEHNLSVISKFSEA